VNLFADDQGDDRATVETGGLLGASEVVVDARRQCPAEAALMCGISI
jgi:hypothetical protein